MEYLLDTANLKSIAYYVKKLPVTGVTSNPSIVKKEGKVDFFAHMKEIRRIIGPDRTLHIQVTSDTVEGMMADARAILAKVDEKVFIKVPVTLDGLEVIKALKAEGAGVTATGVYTLQQGLLSLEAGADFIAPYYNRMENQNIDPVAVIGGMADMIDRYGYRCKILAASFKNAGQINRAFMAGAHTATADPEIIAAALAMPSIGKAVDDFLSDWRSVYGEKTIADL